LKMKVFARRSGKPQNHDGAKSTKEVLQQLKSDNSELLAALAEARARTFEESRNGGNKRDSKSPTAHSIWSPAVTSSSTAGVREGGRGGGGDDVGGSRGRDGRGGGGGVQVTRGDKEGAVSSLLLVSLRSSLESEGGAAGGRGGQVHDEGKEVGV
jgi:hypothetical protein